MRTEAQAYRFETFQDGEVILHKSNYKSHTNYHPEIGGPKGLAEIQDTLIYPDVIMEHDQKDGQGSTMSHNKSYFRITNRSSRKKSRFVEYWVVRLRRIGTNPVLWCITTAFQNEGPAYAMINERVGKVVYKRNG